MGSTHHALVRHLLTQIAWNKKWLLILDTPEHVDSENMKLKIGCGSFLYQLFSKPFCIPSDLGQQVPQHDVGSNLLEAIWGAIFMGPMLGAILVAFMAALIGAILVAFMGATRHWERFLGAIFESVEYPLGAQTCLTTKSYFFYM
jgi:hypothetical protein